jgi:long-chain fatty acid transport protein
MLLDSQMRGLGRFFIFVCAVTLPYVAPATIGMREIGYGVKSRAMGGVGIARPLDVFVLASNPAAMVALCDRFDVGLEWLRHEGRCRLMPFVPDSAGNTERMSSHMLWPEAGILAHWPRRLTAGVAFYAFGGWDVHYRHPSSFLGTSPPGSKIEAYFLTPALALEVGRVHAFGMAVNVAYLFFKAKGLQALQQRSSIAGAVTNRGFDHAYGASVRVGWFARPFTHLWLGITYQSPTWLSRLRRYGGLLPSGQIRLPSEAGAGLTWHFHPLLTASADVLKLFWRDGPLFRNTSEDTSSFGTASGPGLGWRGQLAFRLGLSWEIVDRLTLRGGYCHTDVPMFPSDTFLNLLTMETVKDTVTAGFTWHCLCNEFSFSYMRGLGHHLTGSSNIRLATGSEIVPVRLRSRQDAFGFSYGRRF